MDREMIGTYGEYFVVTRLLSWGYPATVVPGPFTYDVVADVNGTPLRVQIKSTNRFVKKANSYEWNTRRKHNSEIYTLGDYDIMACVAIPEHRMIFMPFHKKQKVSRVKSAVNKEQERKSWENCLKDLGLKK